MDGGFAGPATPEAAELTELFDAAGVPARLAAGTAARLGPTAADRLRADPWRLLAVHGVRPDQADHFAGRLLGGRPAGDPRRGRALVEHLLTRAAGDGHTVLPAGTVVAALASFGVPRPLDAVEAALDAGEVLGFEDFPAPGDAGPGPEPDGGEDGGPGDAPRADGADDGAPGGAPGGDDGGGGGPYGADAAEVPGEGVPAWLGLGRYALAEESLAEGLCRLAATAHEFPGDAAAAETAIDTAAARCGPDVRAALRAVAASGVCVVSTGPGDDTGRLVRGLAALADAGGLRAAVTAPTASAARALGAPATSLHELLGCRVDPLTGAAVPGRDELRPLEADVVVVTGAAALGVESVAALVEACPDGTRLVLAGDPRELHSFSPGRVLGDLVDCGAVPVAELAGSVPRGAGAAIAGLAGAVGAGTLPPVDAPDREVVVVTARDAAEAAHRVVQLVTDSIPRALAIPAGDVQVVTPVRRGAAGADALNAALASRLRPRNVRADSPEIGPRGGSGNDGPAADPAGDAGGPYGPGDRVLLTAGYPPGGVSVPEPGVVAAAGPDGIEVTLPVGTVTVPAGLPGLLRPAWAMTVHRAHGSRWPAVVAVLPGEAAGTLSRPLAYTAFTRAVRHLSVVHAAGPALARTVRTAGHRPRHTRLAHLLRVSASPGF